MSQKILLATILMAAFVTMGARRSSDSSYAEDRAAIEDLQGRYMFALDWQDADTYAGTFTEDGILDWAGGIVQGRAAISAEVRGMRASFAKQEAADAPLRPARLRHVITNGAIRIEGDRASGREYWFEMKDDGPDRRAYLGAYGHYEDELRKVNGRWLFSRRKIYNEQMAARAAPPTNPAW
jgi:hypothetical protein